MSYRFIFTSYEQKAYLDCNAADRTGHDLPDYFPVHLDQKCSTGEGKAV